MGKKFSTKQLKKELKQLRKKEEAIQSMLYAGCLHYSVKNGKSYIKDIHDENGTKYGTCSKCGQKVIADNSIINDPEELKETADILKARINLSVLNSRKGIKRYRMSAKAEEKLLQLANNIDKVISNEIDTIESYGDIDYYDYKDKKNRKKKGKKKKKGKNSVKSIF